MSDPRKTFDDIERYQYIVFRGDPGYVLEKGEHILPASSGSHLQIEIFGEREEGTKTIPLHERIVKRYLNQREKLFVDWDDTVSLHSDSPTKDFPEPVPA
jgi:hypothetical protein